MYCIRANISNNENKKKMTKIIYDITYFHQIYSLIFFLFLFFVTLHLGPDLLTVLPAENHLLALK